MLYEDTKNMISFEWTWYVTADGVVFEWSGSTKQ